MCMCVYICKCILVKHTKTINIKLFEVYLENVNGSLDEYGF